jgi:hypothetical protein
MPNYGISNSNLSFGSAQTTASTSYQPAIMTQPSSGSALVSPPANNGLKRVKWYDVLVGTNGTPADSYVEYSIIRTTIGSTLTWTGTLSSASSAFTLDPADTGFQCFCTINASQGSSASYSVGAEPWYVGVNQRASYRWVAAPGSEIVSPATSSATTFSGLALRFRGTLTTTVTGNVLFSE